MTILRSIRLLIAYRHRIRWIGWLSPRTPDVGTRCNPEVADIYRRSLSVFANVQGYLAPPITGVLLLGPFNQRINSRGAVWGLSVGFILGMTKLVLQRFFGSGKIENPAFLVAIADFNFLDSSGVLFVISIVIIVVMSRTDATPRPEQLRGLTIANIDRGLVRQSWTHDDIVATFIVLSLVASIHVYFSSWI